MEHDLQHLGDGIYGERNTVASFLARSRVRADKVRSFCGFHFVVNPEVPPGKLVVVVNGELNVVEIGDAA